MSVKARILAVSLAALAALVLAAGFDEFSSAIRNDLRGVLIWFGLLSSAGFFTFVALRGGGGVVGTAAVNFAIVITYGGAVAAWLAAIEMILITKLLLRFRILRAVFNTSQIAISLAIAGWVYKTSGGVLLLDPDWRLTGGITFILPLLLCHLAYFTSNTGLVTLWSSFNQQRPPLLTWKTSYLWMLPQSFAAPVVAVILAYLYANFSILLVAVFFLWLVYYARTSKTNLELLRSQRETVAALATTVDETAPHMGGEAERVAALAVELGRRIGLSGWRMQILEYAALVHDIGYLALSHKVLSKDAPLSFDEWKAVRRHAEIGAEIIGRVNALKKVSDIVLAHHERPDGRGYPRGLKGKEIPKEASILKVADAFVAMTTPRAYRPARTVDEAISKIRSGAGTEFDSEVVTGLIELYQSGFLEELTQRELRKAA